MDVKYRPARDSGWVVEMKAACSWPLAPGISRTWLIPEARAYVRKAASPALTGVIASWCFADGCVPRVSVRSWPRLICPVSPLVRVQSGKQSPPVHIATQERPSFTIIAPFENATQPKRCSNAPPDFPCLSLSCPNAERSGMDPQGPSKKLMPCPRKPD